MGWGESSGFVHDVNGDVVSVQARVALEPQK